MNRNRIISSSSFPLGLLSSNTLDALQAAADRKHEREMVQRARERKVPVPYAMRAKREVR